MIAIGLALLFALERPPFLGIFLTEDLPYAIFARAGLEISLIFAGLVLCAAALYAPSLLKAKRPLAWAGGGLVCAATIVMALCSQLPSSSAAILTVSGACFGLGYTLLLAAWFLALRALPSQRILPLLLASFCLSMGSIVIDYAPALPRAALTLCIPLASAGLAALTSEDDLAQGLLKDFERPKFSEALFVDVLAISLMLAEVVCSALIRSLWAHQGIGYATSQASSLTYLASFLLALLCAVICSRLSYAEKGALAAGAVTMPLLLAASFAYLFLQADLVALPLITSISSVALAVLTGMVSITMRGTRRPYLAGAGICAAVLGVSMGLTYNVLPALLGFSGIAPASLSEPVVFASIAVILLALGGALAFTLVKSAQKFESWQESTTVRTIVIKASRQKEEPAPDHGALLEERYGLTKREADIATLLACGYTAKRVADELFLSTNTVQSYTKQIYRKMGVHKKDELIQAVEELGA